MAQKRQHSVKQQSSDCGGEGGGVFLFVCFFCCTKQFNLSLNIVIMVILSGNFVLF